MVVYMTDVPSAASPYCTVVHVGGVFIRGTVPIITKFVLELHHHLCGNQPVRREHFFIKSFLGDDAAVPAPLSGDEAAPPRHRAGVARWRGGRRDGQHERAVKF